MSSQTPQSGWHSDEQTHRSKERLYWLFSSLLSLAVAVGAGFSARYAYKAVVAGQASADASREAASQAKRQAEIAEQQLLQSRSSSRPYVIAQISKDQLSQAALSGSGVDSLIYEFTARLRFTNFGTTPAIIKHIEGTVSLGLQSDKSLFTEEHVTELILSQGQSSEEYIWSRKTNQAKTSNVFVGDGSVYVAGKIVYADTSGQLMSDAFCYRWPLHSHSRDTQLVPAYGPGCSIGRK